MVKRTVPCKNKNTHLIHLPANDASSLRLLHVRALRTALPRRRRQRARTARQHGARVARAHRRPVHARAIRAGVYPERTLVVVVRLPDHARLHSRTS